MNVNDLNQDQIELLLGMLGNQSMQFGNYNNNSGVMNYDAGANANYDAGAGNFTQQMAQQAGWATTQKVSANQSNFQVRCVWAANPAPGPGYVAADVEVLLFQSSYRKTEGGVFLSNGNLQFTNDGGDTATISMIGRNAPTVEEFYNMLETEPMNLGWCRMFVQDEAQKAFDMLFSDRTQLGYKNENPLSPAIYDNQYTQRPLIQDVPLNFKTSKKRGILWTIGTTETSPGTRIVFFIDSMLNPDQALSGKAMMQNLGPQTQFQAPAQPLVNPIINPSMGMLNPPAAQMMQNLIQQKANLVKFSK